MTESPRTEARHRRGRTAKRIGAAAVTGAVLVGAAFVLWDKSSGGAPPNSHESLTATPADVDFTPYIGFTAAIGTDLAATAESTGADRFNLAFVVAGDDCTPVWDGSTALGDEKLADRIAALREAGGDVRVSFGGAGVRELAEACPSVSELVAVYSEVIARYDLTRVDFDIEGDTLSDTAANSRRAEAVALLQERAEADGRILDVSYTLAAMPSGLVAEGIDLLDEAVAAGVEPSAVNIMTMNYSEKHGGDMGEYAIEAATAAQEQIKESLGLSDEDAWKALAVTPMIGVNDIAGETFTLDDAEELLEFARAKGVGWLSMWEVGRDRECEGGAKTEVDNTCSGVTQDPGAFARILAG